MEGEHIEGSPLIVIVFNNLITPVDIIKNLTGPQSIAFNEKGDKMIVAEYRKHRFSIITLKDQVPQFFGKQGNGEEQFNHPCTVAVDDDDNILVVDGKNNRIQTFTPEGRFKACVGKSSL